MPSDFSFLTAADGGCLPRRLDPCTPIPYVIDVRAATAGNVNDAHQAIARLSEASGLRFVYDGEAPEPPEPRWRGAPPYQPEVYGDRWAPL